MYVYQAEWIKAIKCRLKYDLYEFWERQMNLSIDEFSIFKSKCKSKIQEFYKVEWLRNPIYPPFPGRRSPAVACWASDHWVANSNPLRGKFRH